MVMMMMTITKLLSMGAWCVYVVQVLPCQALHGADHAQDGQKQQILAVAIFDSGVSPYVRHGSDDWQTEQQQQQQDLLVAILDSGVSP